MENLVVAVDLGSTKVVAVAAEPTEKGSVRIKGSTSVPCKGAKKGMIIDADEASRAIYQSLHSIQQQIGRDVDQVVLAVSGQHIEGSNGHGLKPIVPRSRQITYQDVLEVVNHSRSVTLPSDREQIQAIPREFRIDGNKDIKQPIGMNGAKLEVLTYLVSGATSTLQSLEKVVTMAGKQVEQMLLRSLCSGIAVLTQSEIDQGAVVVDIGSTLTEVAVFVNGSIAFSATLPVGGSHISSDIAQLLKTTPKEAERLKVEAGNAYAAGVSTTDSVSIMQIGQEIARPLQKKMLAEIIESRAREIAKLVFAAIEASGHSSVLTGGVVLTGGGSLLPGMDRLFDENMKHLRVRLGRPTAGTKSFEPGFAAAVGAARFAIQCFDEIQPAAGAKDWKDRVRSLFSVLRP